MFDEPVADDESQSGIQAVVAGCGEGRKVECVGQSQPLVGDHSEGQPQPVDHLVLIVRFLARQTEDPINAGGAELCVVVPEVTGLRRTASSAWDGIPPLGQIDARPSCQGVEIDRRAARSEVAEANLLATAHRKGDVRHRLTWQMVGRAVVLGDRQVFRELGAVIQGVLLRESSYRTVIETRLQASAPSHQSLDLRVEVVDCVSIHRKRTHTFVSVRVPLVQAFEKGCGLLEPELFVIADGFERASSSSCQFSDTHL